jgi:hypothetical protein
MILEPRKEWQRAAEHCWLLPTTQRTMWLRFHISDESLKVFVMSEIEKLFTAQCHVQLQKQEWNGLKLLTLPEINHFHFSELVLNERIRVEKQLEKLQLHSLNVFFRNQHENLLLNSLLFRTNSTTILTVECQEEIQAFEIRHLIRNITGILQQSFSRQISWLI